MSKEELEVILGRLMYLKVIKELAKAEEPLTKYKIIMRTGLKATDVNRILKNLIKINWVKELDYTPRRYMLNFDKPLVKDFINFLKKWGYFDD